MSLLLKYAPRLSNLIGLRSKKSPPQYIKKIIGVSSEQIQRARKCRGWISRHKKAPRLLAKYPSDK